MRIVNIINFILFILISIFIIYMIWYQYVYGEVAGLISLLGIFLILFSIIKIFFMEIKILKLTISWSLIILYFYFSGVIFTEFSQIFYDNSFKILKYASLLFIIPTYVGYDIKNFVKIIKLLSLTVVLLSIMTIFFGDRTLTGAITVGDYNTNALSNIFIFGTFIILLYLEIDRNSKLRLFFKIGIVLELIAQILTASRRGIVVHILLLGIYILFILKNRKKRTYNLFKIIIILTICFIGMNIFDTNINNLLIIERLKGIGTSRGDLLRNYYQYIAIMEFIENPIFGVGLGGIQGITGVYSHSLYYELLACTGLIGFTLVISEFIKYIKIFRKNEIKIYQGINLKMITKINIGFIICIFISGIAMVFIYDIIFYLMISIIITEINVLKLYKNTL